MLAMHKIFPVFRLWIVIYSLFFGCLSGCMANGLPPIKNTDPQPIKTTAAPAAEPVGLLRYAVFPAPPFMIGAGDELAEMSGIDVEIVQEIARRMHFEVEYIKCTWARCLELMQLGRADLLSSAYKKVDREAFMLYFDRPFLERLPIAFYYRKDRPYSIQRYEDIYQFERIGILRGASYFERFDDDLLAKKFEVSSQDQLFPMLLAGRLDAVAGYVPTENYRISVEKYGDQVQRSTYEYQEQALVYMTISKKSPLVARIEEFNKINRQLLDEGFILRVISSYYEKYR